MKSFKITGEYRKSDDYTKSPFRYPGGKFYALKYILPFINCVPHDEFIEPFAGGGSIFFGKKKSKKNWINDLDKDLINVYKIIVNPITRKKLINKLKEEKADKNRHQEMKSWNSKTRLERAHRTYYLNRTSYSGIIHKPAWGYREDKSSPPLNWAAFIKRAGEKLEGVKITEYDFEKVMEAGGSSRTVFVYLDPPYFHADQKRAYTKSFVLKDHLRLAQVLEKTSHYFCLSYDNCPEVRKLYSWANIYEESWLYNTANINGGNRKMGSELVITNYAVKKLKKDSFPLFEPQVIDPISL